MPTLSPLSSRGPGGVRLQTNTSAPRVHTFPSSGYTGSGWEERAPRVTTLNRREEKAGREGQGLGERDADSRPRVLTWASSDLGVLLKSELGPRT